MSGLNTKYDLNVILLGSYDCLNGMDCWRSTMQSLIATTNLIFVLMMRDDQDSSKEFICIFMLDKYWLCS